MQMGQGLCAQVLHRPTVYTFVVLCGGLFSGKLTRACPLRLRYRGISSRDPDHYCGRGRTHPHTASVIYREDPAMANPAHDRGHAGEQSMGFYWGERGYFLVEGPSGAGGHAANARGFDGVAFNPT